MSRARRTWVVVILVLATFLGFLSILARWADQQALDTNQWVDTSTQMLENEEIRNTLAAYLVDELYANVDVTAELQARLPPELQALAGPAAAGLRDASYAVARRALESPRVQTLWEEANRRAHQTVHPDRQGRRHRERLDHRRRRHDRPARAAHPGGPTGRPQREANPESPAGDRPARGHELG